MKLTTLLLPAALLLGGAAVLPTTDAFAFVVQDDEYAELEAEYEAAIEIWKENIESASKEERRQLRKEKPAGDFWPLFKELADSGSGRAMFWMVANIREAGIKSSEREEILTNLYTPLVAEHANSEWFGDVLTQLFKDRRTVGEEKTLDLFETVISKSESAESRSGAMFQAASMLLKSKEADSVKRGEDYLAKIEANYAETSWAKKVSAMRAVAAVQVGKMAPNFTGKTIDGFEFDLEDYKGKVVMLDFYGFW